MSDAIPPSPVERLTQLFAKVEAFFQAVQGRHASDIACQPGCDDCCKRRLSVTLLEAALIQDRIDKLPQEKKKTLQARALREGPEEPCPALGEGGLCDIYEARPLLCRTHGLPIRFLEERDDKRALPVLDTCPKNFQGKDLSALDPKDILDQTTLSTILGTLDAAFADAIAMERGTRIEIVDLCKAALDEHEEENAESASPPSAIVED